MKRSLKPIRPQERDRNEPGAGASAGNRAEMGESMSGHRQQEEQPGAAETQDARDEEADMRMADSGGDDVAVDEARKARVQGSPYRPRRKRLQSTSARTGRTDPGAGIAFGPELCRRRTDDARQKK